MGVDATPWQACTYFGAFCVGTDIDVRVLKGKKGRNVFTNFGEYRDGHGHSGEVVIRWSKMYLHVSIIRSTWLCDAH